MAANYQIIAKTAAGVRTAVITDFLELAYSKRVNAPGICSFRLKGGHSAIADFENRSQIEIWRRNKDQGIGWYCDFYGLYLDHGYQFTDREIFTAACPGTLWLLLTRWILWYAGTTDRNKFTAAAAETILKTLVEYNAGPSATMANSRLREGAITGLSVQADGAEGETLTWHCPWQHLLPTLQRIAQVGGGDFDLVRTGAATVEFRWYLGQLGTDRTASVFFSLPLGNMRNPRYRHNRIDERTAVLVAGQGEGSDRATTVRTGTDYSSANNVEAYKDARHIAAAAGLPDHGDQYLEEWQARETLSFDVLQTPACLYGSNYYLGDLVTAYYKATLTQKIVGVNVAFKDGQEQITIETETQ